MDEQHKSETTGTAATGQPNGTGAATDAIEQTKEAARGLGEQTRAMVGAAGEKGKQITEQVRAQTAPIYEQGARAGQYVTRNIGEYPFASLVIAAAIGYGIAYLIHSRS